jgi:type I restriction enzyme S subunit
MIEAIGRRLTAELDHLVETVAAEQAPIRRFIVSLTQGTSGQSGSRPAIGEEWGLLKLSAVKNGVFNEHENKVVDAAFPADESLRPRTGDLLVTRSNTPQYVGDACAVTEQPGNVLLPDLIYRLRLDLRVRPEFASIALRTARARHELSSSARGTSQSMVKLRGEDIANVLIPVPTLEKQDALISAHASHVGRANALVSTLTRQIDLLKERRRALITAAVSGELDL